MVLTISHLVINNYRDVPLFLCQFYIVPAYYVLSTCPISYVVSTMPLAHIGEIQTCSSLSFGLERAHSAVKVMT